MVQILMRENTDEFLVICQNFLSNDLNSYSCVALVTLLSIFVCNYSRCQFVNIFPCQIFSPYSSYVGI